MPQRPNFGMRLFLLVLCGASCATLDLIRSSNTRGDPHFYDQHGRVRIFHGANRVQKGFPWYFENQLANDDEMKLMQKLGLNVVRLGYMWTGVNPKQGYINQSYIQVVETIVNKFAAHGVHVLLDAHEDILSSKFCLYDGAPLWVVNKSQPRHPFPWPLKGNCSTRGWMENDVAEAAQQAYQDIYDNTNGMLDDLANFWWHSASAFKSNPGVIGYEIMNEPFAGNAYADPTLLVPGVAGRKNLARMNAAVAKAIRSVDDSHMIFFEPVTWGMVMSGKIAGSGFTEVPGGDNYMNRSTFSYHYYCSTFASKWESKPTMQKLVCDKTVGPLVFKAVEEDLNKFGGAQMMTEGLACPDHNMDECVTVHGLTIPLISYLISLVSIDTAMSEIALCP